MNLDVGLHWGELENADEQFILWKEVEPLVLVTLCSASCASISGGGGGGGAGGGGHLQL